MSTEKLWLDTDNIVLVEGVQDELSGDWANSGSVTGELQESDGTKLADLSGGYKAGSTGDYYLEIPNVDVPSSGGSALTPGATYLIEMVITVGSKILKYVLKRKAGFKRD